MTLLLIILIIPIFLLNVLVGFYAAVLYGYGPPSVQYAVTMLLDRRDFTGLLEQASDFLQPLIARLKALPERLLKRADASAETSGEETKTPSLEETIAKIAETDLADLLEEESEDMMQVVPMQELFDDDLASVLMEQGPEAWLMGEKHVESSILKLNVVMMKSGRFATDLDARLRELQGKADLPTIKEYLQQLKDDCTNYLQNQAQVSDQIRQRADEFGELRHLAEDIEYANMEQFSQLETTLSNLDQFVLRGTPEEGRVRLLKELANLRIARHRLRDMQDKAFLTIVRYEKRVDTISPQLFVDETTGLRNRIGLDAALFEWWRLKRNESRKITFALLDFVRFSEANDEQGIMYCDLAIRKIGKMLEKNFDALDLVGLYCGNCYLVATVNMGPRKTMTEIDRIRQQLAKTRLTYDGGEKEFTLQVTCAVTEVPEEKSDTEVLSVLEKTLAAAKKAAKGQTMIYDPTKISPEPELLDAPDFGLEAVTMDLDE